MAKCFFTGVEQPIEEMLILDITAARKAVQDLKRQIAAVEKIIRQMHGRDAAEVYNPVTKKPSILRFFRVITPNIAQALSAACPGARLFIPWSEFKTRRHEFFNKHANTAVLATEDKSSCNISAETGGDL